MFCPPLRGIALGGKVEPWGASWRPPLKWNGSCHVRFCFVPVPIFGRLRDPDMRSAVGESKPSKVAKMRLPWLSPSFSCTDS